jgi:hypothetical protein
LVWGRYRVRLRVMLRVRESERQRERARGCGYLREGALLLRRVESVVRHTVLVCKVDRLPHEPRRVVCLYPRRVSVGEPSRGCGLRDTVSHTAWVAWVWLRASLQHMLAAWVFEGVAPAGRAPVRGWVMGREDGGARSEYRSMRLAAHPFERVQQYGARATVWEAVIWVHECALYVAAHPFERGHINLPRQCGRRCIERSPCGSELLCFDQTLLGK